MDITVKHGNTTITSYVISYERSHNICTGVGVLELVLDGTYSTSLSPHDSIKIYENGDFKVNYYISDVARNVPQGTITLQCQDKSKYIVDYFIPTSYTIDYPSYTRTWIEQFLTEAKVSYEFTTDSPGNLLSNYTQLGLASAYDQIMMLCQMSGWYFYFDGNGKCIIGSLTTDLSSGGSIGKTDILDIKKIEDDKMLRNRAVVWGQYDGFTGQYAFADVSVNTRWNYDKRDQRAVVISNNNIPDKSSAYGIANQLIKEFARPTIEKHIIVHGARNYNLGEVLGVDSHVWRGKGLITTFGVSMSKDGLVTNIILDERCPRLFGFFDFGDYVYVSTYGEGIWRKHIKFDPTWYDFSAGLTNLNITDLHINNGVFGSVGTSGEMYYANNEAGPWNPLIITDLQSAREDSVSGVLALDTFSGIYAHATIVDKANNTVKFGVDTWPGLNMGDYFMQYSGFTTSASGVSISGGHRGWILECDPYTGELVGGLGSGIYPISVSGSYDIRVIDLENDGYNDYVSVSTGGGTVIPFDGSHYNYGKKTSRVETLTGDNNAYVGLSTTDAYDLEGETLLTSPAVSPYSVFENEIIGERDIVGFTSSAEFQRTRFTVEFDITLGRDAVSVGAVTSAVQAGLTGIIAIDKINTDVYRFYQFSQSSDASNRYVLFEYRDWDANANTTGADVAIGTLTIPKDTVKEGAGETAFTTDFKVINNKIWFYALYQGMSTPASTSNWMRFYFTNIDLATAALEFNGIIADLNFLNGSGGWRIFELGGTFPPPKWLYQNNDVPSVALFLRENNVSTLAQNNYLISSDTGVDFEVILIESAINGSDPNFIYGSNTRDAAQLTRTGRLLWEKKTSNNKAYVYTGLVVAKVDLPTVPIQYQSSKILPEFGQNDNHYVVKDGSNFYFATPFSLTLGSVLTFPANYDAPQSSFRTTSSVAELYFFKALNNDTGKYEILRVNTGGMQSAIKPFSLSTSPLSGGGIIVGNIFTDGASAMYINNSREVLETTRYLVLRRDALDYTIIEQESYPIRIDNSLTAPLLTVGSGDSSFHSNYITAHDLTVIQPAGILNPLQVNDYRYTLLEPTISGVTQSGIALSSTGLFVSSSGIMGFDTLTYSGGFTQKFSVPSGVGTRIETSNYGLNGQYIFVTTSGSGQEFYQKDPDGWAFVLYSGLVQSRATMIRLDDRM